VDKWLTKNIGPVVPAGVQMQGARETAASVGRVAGEVVADPVVAIKGAKAIARGARAVPDLIQRALTSKGAKLTPDVEVPAAGDITKPAFKRWFGDSKIVDNSGNPQIWYHGTPMQFEEFKPGVADAMYFSQTPEFAQMFSGKGPDPVIAERAAQDGWVGPNVVPVYLKANNPFDYENPEHRKMLIEAVLQKHGQKRPDGQVALFEDGKPTLYDAQVLDAGLNPEGNNWLLIERKQIQETIKSLGFDSFYVKENDVKNLGVYKPEQIKSIFNKGNWNPNDPRLLQGAGGATAGTGAATMQDKEQK
jgi:hypothetical protein